MLRPDTRVADYNSKVRELFAAPLHAGDARNGVVATIRRDNTVIVLSATPADGRLAALRFRVRGCPHTTAAAEYLCAECEGQAAEALQQVDVQRIMQVLDVPVAKTGRMLLLEDAAELLYRQLATADDSSNG